ncbi:MAG: MerR family transcriptional regulator [Prevotellaceae bacterium]|jgi:DNA-binding transcriptional MerR regulator|nr:MerR family transcriptional regulator [Prevotellaceae bacterium]
MPYKEPVIEQFHYPIGQVAQMLNVDISTIRYWSDKFDEIIKPQRTVRGNRMYTPQDIETFTIIHNLVKNQGMTLEGAKKRISENREGEYENVKIIKRLENIKAKLLEIKDLL